MALFHLTNRVLRIIDVTEETLLYDSIAPDGATCVPIHLLSQNTALQIRPSGDYEWGVRRVLDLPGSRSSVFLLLQTLREVAKSSILFSCEPIVEDQHGREREGLEKGMLAKPSPLALSF